jgi:hypothetical protein
MVDPKFLPKCERQFLEFPNSDHDDIIDTISQSLDMFRNYIGKTDKKPHTTPARLNPVTGQPLGATDPRKEYLQRL